MRRDVRAMRRHIRDKAVLDHLTSKPLSPRDRHGADPDRAGNFDEEDGRELAEALRKRWTGAGRGLPEF